MLPAWQWTTSLRFGGRSRSPEVASPCLEARRLTWKERWPGRKVQIARTQRSLDSSPDRFEAYRVVAVVGGIIAVVTALLFLLHR